ncbi:MAG TPA: hypothetical protein PK913_04770, partial [Phenylobacterium sp.]|nr:hypothetical protein [Phenylobacterium sp.]
MLRRHFFLAGAILVLIIMVVVGAAKILGGKPSSGPGGPPQAGAGGARPGGGMGGGMGGRGGGPTQVDVTVVQPRTFVDTIDVLGVAKGKQSVTLSAATTQLVDRVLFTPGQAVRQGQVLVELKTTEQDAGIAQSQARALQTQRAYER